MRTRPAHSLRRALGVALALAPALALVAPSVALATDPSPSPAPVGGAGVNTYRVPPSTFGIGPSDTKKPDGRPYFTFAVTPGAHIADHVAVANLSDKSLRLAVYTTSVSNNTNGDFAFTSEGQQLVDAGRWITVTLPHGGSPMTVPARTTAILPVELTLPADASPGDHSAGIVADLTTLAQTTKDGHAVTTTLHQRVGVRIFIRIAGPIRPGLKVEDLHATYHGALNPVATGYTTVSYTVHNVGNVNLGAQQSIAVHGLLGTTAKAKGVADLPLLLPGSSVQQTVRVDGVFPEIHESATVRLTPIHLPSDVDPGLTNTTASTGFFAVPWVLIAIVVAIVLLAITRRRLRRRGVTRGTSTPAAGPPEQVAVAPAPTTEVMS